RSGETAVIVGRDVGRQGEDVLVTTLQALDPTVVDMRCLVIIGTDQTSVVDDRVWTRRSEARVVSAGDRSGDHGR
ncbi:MAG: hypothetical protein L0H26_01710, partial [Microlunatus sp.]|nr:hypothetical protein [Microlunatus sp.]